MPKYKYRYTGVLKAYSATEEQDAFDENKRPFVGNAVVWVMDSVSKRLLGKSSKTKVGHGIERELQGKFTLKFEEPASGFIDIRVIPGTPSTIFNFDRTESVPIAINYLEDVGNGLEAFHEKINGLVEFQHGRLLKLVSGEQFEAASLESVLKKIAKHKVVCFQGPANSGKTSLAEKVINHAIRGTDPRFPKRWFFHSFDQFASPFSFKFHFAAWLDEILETGEVEVDGLRDRLRLLEEPILVVVDGIDRMREDDCHDYGRVDRLMQTLEQLADGDHTFDNVKLVVTSTNPQEWLFSKKAAAVEKLAPRRSTLPTKTGREVIRNARLLLEQESWLPLVNYLDGVSPQVSFTKSQRAELAIINSRSLFRVGRSEESLECISTAMSRLSREHPFQPKLLLEAAQLFAQVGDDHQAIKFARRSLEHGKMLGDDFVVAESSELLAKTSDVEMANAYLLQSNEAMKRLVARYV